MATSPVLISIEEYLHTSYHPDADFVNGEIEERNLGEYEHAKLQGILYALFFNNEEMWQVDTVVEQRIRVNSSRVGVCDIAVLRTDTHTNQSRQHHRFSASRSCPQKNVSRAPFAKLDKKKPRNPPRSQAPRSDGWRGLRQEVS